MIQAKNVKRLIRLKQQDNNEILFSDYDIKNALNEALRYISQSQALQNSDFLETATIFDELELNNALLEETTDDDVELYNFALTGVDLPDDFCTLAGVTNAYGRDLRPVDSTKTPNSLEYKIMGGKIYAGVPLFTLTYKKIISPVSDIDEDDIELPTFCTDIVVKITGMILNNAETDIMLQQIESMSRSIIPRRRYNNPEIKMPFYC